MPSNRHNERCGNSCAQLGQRVDGVGRAGAAHFAIVHDESRLVGHRGAHHRHAQRSIRQRAFAMRWIARRKETHFGELQRLPQLECGAQVPVVDRIEGSAEEANGPLRSIQAARVPGERQRAAARELDDHERHFVPGIAALLTLDHAVGARQARREPRVRQARGAALRVLERRPTAAASCAS